MPKKKLEENEVVSEITVEETGSVTEEQDSLPELENAAAETIPLEAPVEETAPAAEPPKPRAKRTSRKKVGESPVSDEPPKKQRPF